MRGSLPGHSHPSCKFAAAHTVQQNPIERRACGLWNMQKDDCVGLVISRVALIIPMASSFFDRCPKTGMIANSYGYGNKKRKAMKVIQIGVGGFGRHWLRLLIEYPGVELAALVDVDGEALTEAAAESGVEVRFCFRDLDQALKETTADILVCVSPPAFHRQHTTAAMSAGLDIICEKPVAIDMNDAIAMACAARDSGRLMAVSQNYRYRP